MASDSNDKHPKDNDDIKQHLLKIEERLDRLSLSPQLNFDSLSAHRNDEVDLRAIWNVLWDGKWWIIGITFLFTVLAMAYALSLPNWYKAEVVLAPAQEQGGGMGGLAAQYGGLAAIAGINIGGRSTDIDQAMVLVTSWPFLDMLIEKYDLKPLVVGISGWDKNTNKIIFKRDLYDPDAQQWLRGTGSSRPLEPASYEAYEAMMKMVTVNHDAKTGLITLSVEHYVPQIAYEWVGLLVKELNQHFQDRDVRETLRNIDYLRAKINETSVAEMQSVFYRMIESQMKTLMLAEVSGEYLLKKVAQEKLPERKSGPSRTLICVLGVVLGVMAGIFAVMALHLHKLWRVSRLI